MLKPNSNGANMKILLTVVASYILYTPVHLAGLAIANWLVGGIIEEITLFAGPNVKRFKLNNIVVNLNLLPLGGFVKFSEHISTLHPLKRIVGNCGGIVALLIFANCFLGTSIAYQKFSISFSQLFWGTLAPSSTGAALVNNAYEFLSSHSFIACLGWTASKYAAIELLPLFTFNGGQIAINIVSLFKPVSLTIRERLQGLSFLICLAMLCCWVYAIYIFMRQ
jgi:hypothetical protein